MTGGEMGLEWPAGMCWVEWEVNCIHKSVEIHERHAKDKKKIINTIFIYLFWLHSAACGILVPSPEIEPMPPEVEAHCPGPPGKSVC